jgi:hypothetical protein
MRGQGQAQHTERKKKDLDYPAAVEVEQAGFPNVPAKTHPGCAEAGGQQKADAQW